MLLTVSNHDAKVTIVTYCAAAHANIQQRTGWTDRRLNALTLTGDGVLVAVAFADADQEGTIFVLGCQQQLLGFHTIDIAIVPPAETTGAKVRPLFLALTRQQVNEPQTGPQ